MRKLALLCIFAAVCCIALAAVVFLRPAPAADPASGSVSAPVSSAPDPTAAPAPSPTPPPPAPPHAQPRPGGGELAGAGHPL